MTRRRTAWGAYVEIARVLRSRIASGVYPLNSRIPGEIALGEEFGVGRTAVRNALGKLESEGWIKVVDGLGRYVCDPEVDLSVQDTALQYERIAAELRAQIESGDLAPGDALPSEHRVRERYGVSRFTARQALIMLERAGLVECIHGKGRFVRSRRP
ncbi:GntR family transcriptional regulator [Spirillospora sp. NPDC048911]|uniref:GntR family transcriptional regulator n=1 Tax=Spirillospora sp. NPDC048911 TaxID=3364527 RepID=UPI003721D175